MTWTLPLNNASMIHTIDLQFLQTPRSIAAFAIPDQEGDGYTLVECGPFSTHDTLLAGLAKLGIQPSRVHTLLLTHIHFDHAGAAWWWARQGTQVYVHPRGHQHLVDPTRLYQSARQIYGQRMDELWGEMRTIPASRVNATEDRQTVIQGGRKWTAHHTPGHASHHIAWQLADSVFTGDVAGCRINDGPVVPPLPPPDIDLPAWRQSLARLKGLNATKLYLTHYGPVKDVGDHLGELADRLERYFAWIEPYYRDGTAAATMEPLFKRYVTEELTQRGVPESDLAAYLAANPPYMSVVGMLRYLTLRDRQA